MVIGGLGLTLASIVGVVYGTGSDSPGRSNHSAVSAQPAVVPFQIGGSATTPRRSAPPAGSPQTSPAAMSATSTTTADSRSTPSNEPLVGTDVIASSAVATSSRPAGPAALPGTAAEGPATLTPLDPALPEIGAPALLLLPMAVVPLFFYGRSRLRRGRTAPNLTDPELATLQAAKAQGRPVLECLCGRSSATACRRSAK